MAATPKPPRILIVAGSDSGGGAGIQADIKTITMLGGHAMTAITAQNTLGVQAVHMVPTDVVLAQIESCVSDIGVDAAKIGMIGSAATAHAVADRLAGLDVPIVFDPVMVATSGSVLADENTIAAFERLMRIASLVTPNLPELAVLSAALASGSDHPSTVRAEPVEAPSFQPAAEEKHSASTASARAGMELARRFGTTVLVKGGHTETTDVTDILYAPAGETARWSAPRIDTTSTHGTGCTLASAIATGLGQGMDLPDAAARAIRFVRRALQAAPGFGKGHGPMGQQSVTDIR